MFVTLHSHDTAPVGQSRHWDRFVQPGSAGMIIMPPAQAQVVPSMHCHVFVVSSWSLQQQVRVSCCLPGAGGWLLGRACSSKGSAGADPGSGTDTSTKSCQMLLCGEALMSAEPLLDDFPWFSGQI